MMTAHRRILAWWAAVGAIGFLLVPWYALQDTVLSLGWLAHWREIDDAPAVLQAALHGRAWLWPLLALLAAAGALIAPVFSPRTRSTLMMSLGAAGVLYGLAQGFAIGAAGWSFETISHAFGPLAGKQFGMGFGATLTLTSFAMVFAIGMTERGWFKGDVFIAGCVVAVMGLVVLFTFFPVIRILISALQDSDGALSFAEFLRRFTAEKVWGLGCVGGSVRCGVAWNTLFLAFACAILCTGLGLAFALIVTRTDFRFKRLLRTLSVLPIITPPFVIGLGLILLFGRAGLVNHLLEYAFGVTPARWFYGMQGILVAQVFAFTPIAFLVLIGVVEGVSPAMEEAAQTLRAGRWRTFVDVSLPLMRPGLANAFLITFIESIADFGNPIILGGNFGVLSTEVFFSVVGAQLDQGRAATLGIVLLLFALGAFLMQRAILGSKVYTAMSGKGDSGVPAPLPDGVRKLCYSLAVPWLVLTIVVYSMTFIGGFVETWGRDYTPTFKHYIKAFGVEWGPHGLLWAGAAWNSFWTTMKLSAIAAPLTAAMGIIAAWLLTRQRFVGQSLFEFGTMLSFAIPGTVIGVSYILAFNVPPIEMTGTALILIVCNVFRNMPVGVRAGMAAMSQIDRSLDEASMTLGARGATTLRTILLPLLKPALIAALVYSFVRAVTTVSAVIFLVSAQYEWATTYIINRVVNGDYGVAIAYSSVLIVIMLIVIFAIQKLVGQRKIGRRARIDAPRAVDVAQIGGAAA
ncbi:MAG: iron ABC transporter permease [Betaproteobacteria bacterium]